MAKNGIIKRRRIAIAWDEYRYLNTAHVPEFTPPSALSVTPSGTTNALAWTNGTASAASLILRSPTEFGAYVAVHSVAAGVATYNDTGLSNGTYWYKIQHSLNGYLSDQTASDSGLITGGSTSGQITATGTGFGTGPTVVMFDRFDGQSAGETINQVADIGAWDASGPPLRPNRPPVVEFDGRFGVSHNDPTNGSTRYGLIVTGLPQHTKYLTSFKIGVPAGKYFPGAQATQTFNTADSVCKVAWHSGLSSHPSAANPGNPDICTLTFTPSVQSVGNNNLGVGRGSTAFRAHFAWNKWNTIVEIHSPDPALVTGPNGTYNMTVHNSNGLYSSLPASYAAFNKSGGTLNALYFDRISFLSWSGNADMSNAQLVGGQFYMAIGDNADKYIVLGNASSLAACTDAIDIIAPDSWSDTEIKFTPTAAELADNTHYFIMHDQTVLASGAL